MKQHMATIIFSILLLGVSTFAQGVDDIVPYVIEESSSATNVSSAKKDIYDKVVQQATREQILQMIPQEQFDKKRAEIYRKILNQSGKYIPYDKMATPEKRGNLYYSKVELQLSPGSLLKVLENEGILFLKEGSRLVLPMITYLDQKESRSYKWWLGAKAPTKTFLWRESREFVKSLRNTFWKNDLNIIDASFAGFGEVYPQAYRYDTYRTEDLKLIGKYFQSQLLLVGLVKYSPGELNSLAGRIRIQIKAVLTGSGRVVGEIDRDHETSVGDYSKVIREAGSQIYKEAAEQLAEQIIKSWQKGLFGTTRVKLAINGSFSYDQLEQLKKMIVKKNLNIKNLKERLFAPDQIVFELDISGGGKNLAKQMAGFDFSGRKFKVSEVDNAKVELEVE